jgi:hypothetical protein
MISGAMNRSLVLLTGVALLALAACSPESNSSKDSPEPVRFATASLPVSSAAPGDMIAIDISGTAGLTEGFLLRFTHDGNSVMVPPFHVDAGKAYVMVPPVADLSADVALALCDINGKVIDHHPETLEIEPAKGTLTYDRASFDAAVGQGLASFVNLAVECVDTLEAEGLVPAADAVTIRDALEQQIGVFLTVGVFNDNLNDDELGLLQQLLDNSGLLTFIADAGGVSLQGYASQSSSLSSWWASMIQSALLKADFASLLIGEVRGALNLLAWVMNQVSGWPFIGSWAQGVATWATGLSASLQPAHELINTMIPCDLVQITSPQQSMAMQVGQYGAVTAYGRFETEGPFNQQLFTQTITTYVNQAAAYVINQMNQSPVLGQYSSYVQQVATLVPQWINNWLQQNGYYQQSVVPGSNFTVLVIDNFSLDMSQYRFDVAGIVANLLNLPYSAVNAFFNWIGIGVGQPVGGFAGVETPGSAQYLPALDAIEGVSPGSGTAQLTGVVCQPAGGWWAQWGFYGIKKTQRGMAVTVY